MLRKVSRKEFHGDDPSWFPRLLGVTEPFNAEFECAVRRHAMLE